MSSACASHRHMCPQGMSITAAVSVWHTTHTGAVRDEEAEEEEAEEGAEEDEEEEEEEEEEGAVIGALLVGGAGAAAAGSRGGGAYAVKGDAFIFAPEFAGFLQH
jgi:hypothetical protein